jgi:hypothetical protein
MLQLASQRNLTPIPGQSSHLSDRSAHRRLIAWSGPIRASRSRLVQEVMMPRKTIDPNNSDFAEIWQISAHFPSSEPGYDSARNL